MLTRLVTLILMLALSALATAAPRVALLVGNAAYRDAPLVNPPNDVRALAGSLKELGFDVRTVTNVDQKAMQKAIREFGEGARQAEVALFYYSGHGLQSRGENYLVPIGAQINYESDIADEAVSANSVLRRLEEAAPKATVVIMDACRDNPVAGRTKSAGKGLSRMDAPSGTLVAYATAPGTTAGDEGYYAKSLAKHIKQPGLDIKEVFDKVGAEVDRLTRGKQKPRKDDGLYDKVYLVAAPSPDASQPPTFRPAAIDPDAAERAEWALLEVTGTAPAFQGYLDGVRSGKWRGLFVKEAAAALKRLIPASPPAPPPVAERRPGDSFRDCPDCPEMVVIPAGNFDMGSPASEIGRDADEGPVHRVRVQSFALARTEVTLGEFRAFVRDTGYRTDAEKNAGNAQGCYAWEAADGKWDWRAGRYWEQPGFEQVERQPVACISWNDAQSYVKWLAGKTGQTYRLPSEAEWEYAARAGSTTARPWGDDADRACGHANVADQTKSPNGHGFNTKHECQDGHWFTAPVASYRPNGFGLYDMIGNVWEWTEDCYHDNYSGAPTDGSAWTGGSCEKRVLRGGSWGDEPGNARSAKRSGNSPAFRFVDSGFRLARGARTH